MTSEKFGKTDRILITAALPYCNNVPHLGNIIGSTLSADVFARYKRLRGNNVLFICGTDEYGTATEIKATELKLTPQKVCDKYHRIHKDIYKWFNISFDYFGRTSTKTHTELVGQIATELVAQSYIDIQDTKITYCDNCNKYIADRFVFGICPKCKNVDARGDQCSKCDCLCHPTTLIKPCCKICQSEVSFRTKSHLFLLLNKLQPHIPHIAGTHNATTLTQSHLNVSLCPKDISRDLEWGVPVSSQLGVNNQVFYVWFDAPLGYISITKEYTKDYMDWWGKESGTKLYHFIGKDNILFHSIYFPATLAGVNKYIFPHYISSTHYLNYNGQRFSKRNGVGVFGDDAMKSGVEPDVWRIALILLRPEKADTDFTIDDLLRTRKWLRQDLANLVSRITEYIYKKYNSIVPQAKIDLIQSQITSVIVKQYIQDMDNIELKQGLQDITSLIKQTNTYLTQSKFWEQSAPTKQIIYTALCMTGWIAILLKPFAPVLSEQMIRQLGVSNISLKEPFNMTSICTRSHLPTPFHLLEPLGCLPREFIYIAC